MEAIECIKTRRSIRQFKNKDVCDSDIKEIVDISAFAPSWKNSQTVRYILVKDKDLKARLANECTMGFDHNKGIINGASAVMVLTTVDKRSGYERDGSFSTSKGTHWQSFDAGVAAQTFCLTAHEKGLATVIMGIFDAEKVHDALSLPDTQSVSALIAIGFADESGRDPVRKTSEELLTIR